MMGRTGYSDEEFYDPFGRPYARWISDHFLVSGYNLKDLRVMLASEGPFGGMLEDQVASSSSSYHGARLLLVSSGDSSRQEAPCRVSGTYSVAGSVSSELTGRRFCLMATNRGETRD